MERVLDSHWLWDAMIVIAQKCQEIQSSTPEPVIISHVTPDTWQYVLTWSNKHQSLSHYWLDDLLAEDAGNYSISVFMAVYRQQESTRCFPARESKFQCALMSAGAIMRKSRACFMKQPGVASLHDCCSNLQAPPIHPHNFSHLQNVVGWNLHLHSLQTV
jgi:hypothetical protein